MTAIEIALFAALGAATACFVLSQITGNCSQVDRFWSIAPPLYVALFASQAGFADARLDLMLVLTAAWGARLTYNFARKGGYSPGSEDYRWPVLRSRMSKTAFFFFNLGFIALFQNVLLLLLALPAGVALLHRTPLGPLDYAAAALFVLFLVGEAVADEQQWRFQEGKRLLREQGGTPPIGFLTTGLFRYSRHPNFFCEMGMWWCVYAMGVASGGEAIGYALIGPAVLTLLFQGSTSMTEGLSLEKYPDYADYQKRTSRLIPLPPRAA